MRPGADDATSLVLLAMAGSDGAFEQLVRRHQRPLVALLTRVCGSGAVAQDVSQAAFLKAWRNLASLRDASRFGPWLRQIAMRAAIDVARGAEHFDDLDEEIPDAAGAMLDARLDLDAAFQRLTPPQRACVLLAHAEGLSHAEIAAELDLPVGTVKSHVARGVRVLRRVLSAEEQGA
jgi:RNA polymerase sigma factor (sigma-70 family)